ncbi:MAG: PepSY domain-containing protein [Bacteroidota bacterium]
MARNKQYFFRKAHRYLGLFIGIQFLGWTISGLFFSWNNLDDVHGDNLLRPAPFLSTAVATVSPSEAIRELLAMRPVDSIHSIHLIRILDKPVYQIVYFSGHSGEGMHHHVHYALADATTGKLRPSLTKDEAVKVALENVRMGATVSEVKYLEQTSKDHEYRERPLPAWAVSFSDPKCTAYISAEMGTFQNIRHDQWRVWDFLWMFHTMDYESRDDINNWLLKIFSIAGLVTVISGFILFFMSSRTLKKITA